MTTTTILRFSDAAWQALSDHHRHGESAERASVALGHVVKHKGRQIVMVDTPGVALLGPDDYAYQHAGGIGVKTAVTKKLMWWFAQSEFNAFISIHDHWFSGSGTNFSGGDNRDDIAQDLYLRGSFARQLKSKTFGKSKGHLVHASIVFDQSSCDARIINTAQKLQFGPVSQIQVAAAKMTRIKPNTMQRRSAATLKSVSRHRDFIPQSAQQAISEMRVGIVGCGGLGPIIAENLMRLGVRQFCLFDPDRIDESNLNRWLDGCHADVGRHKVSVLADRMRRCEPTVQVEEHALDIIKADPVGAIGTCDLLLSAVDSDAARLWLNRVAAACLIPLFDVGVRVRTDPRVDFLARVVPVLPGKTACLECSPLELLSAKEIASQLHGITKEVREKAGYVATEQVSAPSVMGINTQVAGLASLDILSFVCGWNDMPTPKISTWSTSKTVVIEKDSHLPAAGCMGCGSDARLRHPGANAPRYQSAQRAMAGLDAIFSAL